MENIVSESKSSSKCSLPPIEADNFTKEENDVASKAWKDRSVYKQDVQSNRPESRVDYSSSGGPLVSYVWCEDELKGQELYLGADVCEGKIYCIPGHAQRVLQVDQNDRAVLVGPVFRGKYKWLRGVKYGRRTIYGLPCHAGTVLKIYIGEDGSPQVSELSINYEDAFPHDFDEAERQRKQQWKYHGGCISPVDDCIYCIPQSATHVLKIDPSTDQCTLFGSALPGRYKWYGGVVTGDAIYGIPHNSPSVLRIHPEDGVTLHGKFEGLHKWHGASRAPNGTIVCIPANADAVLCIDPGTPCPILYTLGESTLAEGSMGRHRFDRKYKFLGGSHGPDGRVYCFPCAAERVLAVDPKERKVVEIGPNLYDENMERICQNKWQNGVYDPVHRIIWGVPLAAESVLRISFAVDGEDPIISTWPLPSPHRSLSKWEGGVLGANGAIYTVPNNHKALLRVETTGTSLAVTRESPHLRYRSGIPTLRASAHRVKYSKKHRKHDPRPLGPDGQPTGTLWLPPNIRQTELLRYDVTAYDFAGAVIALLQRCDPDTVGRFDLENSRHCALEDFRIPISSTWRRVNGGQCENAQRYLSNQIRQDDAFLEVFDSFVREVVAPYLRNRLSHEWTSHGLVELYYQRPPTLRLQPGPAWAQVNVHNDAEYGHQYGELNFWVPLTSRHHTMVDLWCESQHSKGDYRPVCADVGEVAVFHGSSCRHYVPNNPSHATRVSFDFRIGIQGFFDPTWEMQGTNDDHTRECITVKI